MVDREKPGKGFFFFFFFFLILFCVLLFLLILKTFVYQTFSFPSSCKLPSSLLKTQTTTPNIFAFFFF